MNKIQEILKNLFVGQCLSCYSTTATWNTTSVSATTTKIFLALNKNSLYKDVKADYETSKKSYMHGFKKIIEELRQEIDIDNNSEEIRLCFIDVIEQYYREYNLHNYYLLLKENRLELLHEFDTNFRGNIAKIHNINNKYFIIETYKGYEEYKKHFYFIQNDGKLSSYVFYEFEQALFNSMNERHANAIYCLFKDKGD